MFQQMKKRIKNEKGLTLIELLAVIVILAIVAAISVPAIGNIIDNSRYNAVKADAINVLNAANMYFTDEGSATTVTVATLSSSGYLETTGAFEGVKATATVKKVAGGNTLEATGVKFSGDKTVTFELASIALINSDKAKGGSITSGYKVGTTKQ